METLVLRGTADGTFAIPKEWTDLADPSPYHAAGLELPIHDVRCLLALVELVQAMDHRSREGVES